MSLDEDELEKEDTWDFGRSQRRRPVKNPRSIVSVAFSADEFQLVVACAEREGKRTSQFIREAALEGARSGGGEVEISSPSWSIARYIFPLQFPTVTTLLRSEVVEIIESEPDVTSVLVAT